MLGATPSSAFHLQGTFLMVEEVKEEVPAEHDTQSSESESEGSRGELQSLRSELEAVKAE